MDIFGLARLVYKNIKYLIIIPLIAGVLMYLLTRNQQHTYTSTAAIFTAITSNTSLSNLDGTSVDFFATKTAYNNIISLISSREVIEETALRLLARHLMLDKPSYTQLSENSYNELRSITPPEILNLADKNSEEKTFQNLHRYLRQDKKNFLYALLNYNHPHYSISAISKIKTTQVGSSDVIQLTYESDDPGVAYQTLDILLDVFLRRYAELKKNQTDAVVEYFKRQLAIAQKQLDQAEDSLLKFNKRNSIINYYEQTKQITTQQEKIDVKQQDVLMDYKSSIAALGRLENEAQIRFKINLRNSQLMDIRRELIGINQQLAKLEIFEGDSTLESPQAQKLTREKQRYENDLRVKIDSINVYSHNSDGIATDVILNEWLKTVIDYESSKARLQAMNEKSMEFNKKFGQFAPLGAMLSRIEREISVKEKAYLEILHHLGLAILKQQNEEMMSNMKIMDQPTLPIEAKPAHRKLLVFMAMLIAFIFTLMGIVLIELFDKTIKTATRFTKQSGIKVIGEDAYRKAYKNIDPSTLRKKGLKAVIEEIIEAYNANKGNSPISVQLFSMRKGEGKSDIANGIASELDILGYKNRQVEFNRTDSDTSTIISIPLNEVFNHSSYAQLVPTADSNTILIVEVPALGNTIFNTDLYKTAQLSYLVVDAGRVWTQADKTTIETLIQLTGINLQAIINKVQPENMEDFIGEIPKQRSRIRRFIKYRLLRRVI